MYDKSHPHKEYLLANKKIIWFWDDTNNKAENFMINNVFVCDENEYVIWNMRDVQNFDDVCTSLTISENTFYFYTFCGYGVTMDIYTLQVVDKKIVK